MLDSFFLPLNTLCGACDRTCQIIGFNRFRKMRVVACGHRFVAIAWTGRLVADAVEALSAPHVLVSRRSIAEPHPSDICLVRLPLDQCIVLPKPS